MNTGPGHSAHGPSSLPNWWPADPRHTSTSTPDVMSQLCRVCGEPAAGFHFGAFTCEGCKSFFGRTYNNLSSISECKNNGECVINKKNRTSCKACRLRKCLVVGMSKSGSRYGRRSNWFKIHCLLQEQQQHHQQHHQQHNQQQQQQQQQQLQNPLHQAGGLAGGLQHFQHHLLQQQSLRAGRTPPPPPPLPWADVKHHLRLDADNNNSVAGDPDKQDAGGGRLSASAAAAAAAVVQAVRPELLRWPSPFFPAFPFPPAAPFFLALQPPPPPPSSRPQPPPSPPSPRPPRGPRSSSSSPASRSSTAVDDDGDDDCEHDAGGGGGGGQPAPKRAAVRRDAPPVQESPMDLSVSALAAASPPRSPPRSSDRALDARSPGTDRSADPSGRDHRRRRRRLRRPRRPADFAAGRRTSGSDTGGGPDSDSCGPADAADERPAKNVPLDLTFGRS